MGKKKIDINAKKVNNAVKNNANMDGWNELVQSAKEFKSALDDEVANREYERKNLAKKFEKATGPIEIKTNSGAMLLSSEPRGRVRTYDDWYGMKSAVASAMQAVEDAINAKIDKKREAPEKLEEAFWLAVKENIDQDIENTLKKLKPASDVESLKAELENLKAHFEGVCAERDNLAACLESCERDLKRKEKVIERIKKKNAKRMAEKCEVIKVLNEEIVFQHKRREKAEKFVNTLGQAFDLLKKNVEDYEHSIGR